MNEPATNFSHATDTLGSASGEVYAAVLEAFREQGIVTTPVSRREVRLVGNQA
jgi:hypothetical protein